MLIHRRRFVGLLVSLAALTAAAPAVYQHNQTDLEFHHTAITDGTSNTVLFGE